VPVEVDEEVEKKLDQLHGFPAAIVLTGREYSTWTEGTPVRVAAVPNARRREPDQGVARREGGKYHEQQA
jgi:uncharacterized protein YacL (UPF0231 family)